MKNKRLDQAKQREEHKLNLSSSKTNRRTEPILSRAEPIKLEKPTILIVCEGKNTEPSYFEQFKLSSATIRALGNGNNTISLVRQAIDLNTKGTYDQVWCVFDKDSFSASNFNNAIKTAKANGFNVAYSNQSFEYWLLLHFEDHQGGGMNRKDYAKTINKYINPLGAKYDGSGTKKISEEFFELLNGKNSKLEKPRIDIAVKRAKRIYNLFDHINPAKEESSTTVFLLIEEIQKYI
jgi:hypothetical protein